MKLRFFLAAILLTLALPLGASAQVSIKKDRGDQLRFVMNPGDRLTHSFSVVNVGTEEIEVMVYATDGTLTSSGGYTVRSRGEEKRTVGKWITLDQRRLTLKPREEKRVTFTIEVPQIITPGAYAGGFSVEKTRTESQSQATGGVVSTRVATPIFVTIPGEKITKYDWEEFSYRYSNRHAFNVKVSNEGNTIVQVKGDITITDQFGNSETLPLSGITLLQNTSSSPQVSWNANPYFGLYTATANLTFSELDLMTNKYVEVASLTKEVRFTAIPWNHIFVLLGILVAVLAGLAAKKFTWSAYKKKCGKYAIKEGDTINKLAEAYNVSWKKLARLNRLTPPYELKKGQTILVPPKK